MRMAVCVYMCNIYMYVCMYVCIYIYIYIYIYICERIRHLAQTRTTSFQDIHTYIHEYIHSDMHKLREQPSFKTYMHTYIHTYIQICINSPRQETCKILYQFSRIFYSSLPLCMYVYMYVRMQNLESISLYFVIPLRTMHVCMLFLPVRCMYTHLYVYKIGSCTCAYACIYTYMHVYLAADPD